MEVMGSANPFVVFVYGLSSGQPKRLWIHETGDRADEGLRKVYVSAGPFLVIEQYNANQLVSREGVTKVGVCCPASFTRTFYGWEKFHFSKQRQEAVRNEYPDARVLMNRRE